MKGAKMLRHTRHAFQHGWIECKETSHGEVFVYRWRERLSEGGYRKRALELGLVSLLKSEANAWHEVARKKLTVNSNNPKGQIVTFGVLVDRYIAEEMNQQLSTRTFY